MDAEFWHWVWDRNLTGFHQEAADAFLVRHLGSLGLAPGSTIFVPLCGKTRDIGWLLAQGHQVVAVELSPVAVEQLFADLGVVPQISEAGRLSCHSAPGVRVFVGDVFDLTADLLGPVALTFDRAALFALPETVRPAYAAHLAAITAGAPHLLISVVYDQSQMRGPPYSVNDAEVLRLYAPFYRAEVLERVTDAGSDGALSFEDVVWHLQAKA